MRDARRSTRPATETKRCAVYTRKSTSAGLDQDFNSLDAQREACTAYVQRQPGWTLVDERYDDGGFTGANIERPAFQRLLTDIGAGKIDVVVVYKVDRLSRSLLDFAKLMERFGAGATSFVSITQNFSTADAMGRLTLNMLMSFAEFEREMIGERTRDKIAAARRKGKWTGGIVPLGYHVVEKKLVVDELEAVVVRETFALYLEHRSPLKVARLLNERHRSTKRHRAGSGHLRESRPWTKTDVLRVLKNPVYGGLLRGQEAIYPAEHSAIVDPETFARVRAHLAAPRKADPGRNPDYILRGILRCACCGSAFTPCSTRSGKKEYRYYRCVRREEEGRQACPSSPLPAGAIEGFVVERLRDAVADGALAQEVTAEVKKRVGARRKELVTERKKLPGEIAKLSSEGKRLVETMGDLTEGARRLVERRLQEIGDQLERLEARLSTVERETAALASVEVEAGWVGQVLADFTSVWDVLTPENRGRLLRAVVQSVEVDERANKVTMRIVNLGDGPLAPAEAPREQVGEEVSA